MGCAVKACIQPPRENGYCRAHQWVIDGNALGSVAASKPTAPAKPAVAKPEPLPLATKCTIRGCDNPLADDEMCTFHKSQMDRESEPVFKPRIFRAPPTGPGSSNWPRDRDIWRVDLPHNRTEAKGVVGLATLDSIVTVYLKLLKGRYDLQFHASDIEMPEEFEKHPAPAANQEVTPPKPSYEVFPRDNRMQWEHALEAVEGGVSDSVGLAAKMNIDKSKASALLSQLWAKGKIDRREQSGSRSYIYFVGELGAVTASERVEEIKTETRITERKVTIERRSENTPTAPVPEKAPEVQPVLSLPAPDIPPFRFVAADSPAARELIDASIRFYTSRLTDLELEDHVTSILPELTAKVCAWRKAKALTDRALAPLWGEYFVDFEDDPEVTTVLGQVWRAVHTVVLNLVLKVSAD